MGDIKRFGVSLEKSLLEKFDQFIKEKNYPNRSEAFRDLIRKELVKEEWRENKEVAGAIVLVYNHHRRQLLNKITDLQHQFQKLIISTQHIHLDHENCLEIIAVKGQAKELYFLRNKLESIKGIKHIELSMATTGKAIE